FMKLSEAAPEPEVEQTASALLAAPEPAEDAAPLVEPEPDEPEVEEPAAPVGPVVVAVRVETVPAGAEAVIEGVGTKCGPTPCELETLDGEEITIHAERGRAQGSTVVTPEGRATVQILLTEPKRARTGGTKPRKSTTTTTSGRGDDLKIPDIFR